MSITAVPETTSGEDLSSGQRRTRVDTPHPVDSQQTASDAIADSAEPLGQALLEVAEEPTPSLVAAVAGETLESRREQLQLQVSQLAGHLRERLREVDRREAAVNARASQLEADLRANRLWLRERENEFQQREQELTRKIEELEERAMGRLPSRGAEAASEAPGDAGDDDEGRQHDLAEREHQIQLKESDLRERRFEQDRQSAALRHAQQVWEHQRSREQQELVQERARLEAEYQLRLAERESEWKAAEQLLREHAAQLDRDQAALAADRRAWDEQKSRQQHDLATEKQAALAEMEIQRERQVARQDWIERQKAGVEQLRSEVLSLHRQSLEMRLVAEQLWAQITGRLSPAEATHTLAQLRLKLVEQFKLDEESVRARREELVALGERITAQHAELKQLQSGLREWAATRQAEIEQQAAALVGRELALDSEQEQHRRAQHAWQADRRRLEQQLRELTAQQRSEHNIAARREHAASDMIRGNIDPIRGMSDDDARPSARTAARSD
jgi:hypothetical protein